MVNMNNYLDQIEIETNWSKSIGINLVKTNTSDIPLDIIRGIKRILGRNIYDLNKIEEVYDLLIYLLFKDNTIKPIQAIACQIGLVINTDKLEACVLGLDILLQAKDLGLYNIVKKEEQWYINPCFILDKASLYQIKKLQFLPPMQIKPVAWTNNNNGGWLKEHRHIILGKNIGRHNEYQCLDVLNKIQDIPLRIDTKTYLSERQNHNMKKQPFLRTVKEYLDKEFYFVWQYDTRGRMYSSGYYLNIQSNEYGKALLEFSNKEYITDLDNMYIAIANHAGKDKLTWQDRIEWVKSLQGDFSTVEWKEPLLGRKAVRALEDMLSGKPTGYMMGLDATASGLQIMAVLSGCKETGKYVNLIDPNIRYDIYTVVADKMNQLLKGNKVKRANVKKALMTHFYNSEANPKYLLGEGEELEVFYQVVTGLLPGAEKVMKIINSVWNSRATEHSWTMPDGHRVIVPVIGYRDFTLKNSELGEIPFRYYTKVQSDNYRSLCPNIIHSIDAYIAREMVRRCDFQMLTIHDCFLFNPSYIQKVLETHRSILQEISNMNLLEHIIREISNNNNYTYTKESEDMGILINRSRYSLS